MFKMILAVLVTFLVIGTAGNSCATIMIDPSSGWSGGFAWFDQGQIDHIDTNDESWNIDWSITIAKDSIMPKISVYDEYIPGDEFSLYVDGAQKPWLSTFTDMLGYFHGEYDDLFLTAGTHTFTLYVTQLAPESDGEGSAHAAFSPISPAPTPTPEPGTFALLGAALGGLIIWNRAR